MGECTAGSILSVESNQNVEAKNVESKIEKCVVQPKQYLYTSRNSLFWALTHLIPIQYKS